MIKIERTSSSFEREPLVAPFGFKGGYLDELWQSVALLQTARHKGVGLGTQSVLWSDAEVFATNSQAAGNCLMYLMTAYALRAAEQIPFETPIDLLDRLIPVTYEYGRKVCERDDLRLTFALNALVAVDNAAWQLYCAENGIDNFDKMIPDNLRSPLKQRHSELACIPLITYGTSMEQVLEAVDQGHGLLKIKIGADPDKDGDQDKMLEWDKRRLSEIHEAVRERAAAFTTDGHVLYYLDANGRYDSRDRLMRLMDHAGKIGALERVILLEEPFPEDFREDVSDIPARLAADESVHSDQDALERIQMGYGALALKPIAKTLSMSLKVANVACKSGVPCFCADLTVNPVLVDWNKNVAARLDPLPGLKIGAFETNGHQNYRNWEAMKSHHPCSGASWTDMKHGVFHLDDDFYATSGGILQESEYYSRLVK